MAIVASDIVFRYSTTSGSVLKQYDGTYQMVAGPTDEQVEAAAIAYLGGRIYTVSPTEAAALTAAGYEVTQ